MLIALPYSLKYCVVIISINIIYYSAWHFNRKGPFLLVPSKQCVISEVSTAAAAFSVRTEAIRHVCDQRPKHYILLPEARIAAGYQSGIGFKCHYLTVEEWDSE